MTDFGGPREFTTWDGEPVSRDRPHGATVVVASRAPDGWRYLLLHRAHHGGPAREGDWAWTPPTGSRKPGEDVTACAVRELQEEVGFRASPRPVLVDDVDWAVYSLEAPGASAWLWTDKSTTDSNGYSLPRRNGDADRRNWPCPSRTASRASSPPLRRRQRAASPLSRAGVWLSAGDREMAPSPG